MSKTHHESKNRILKEQVVEDIKAKLDGAQSVVICSYNGLTVADVTELRALCRAQDVHYCVLKNRLVLKALQEKGMIIAGTLPDDSLVEMIEVKDHPWFVATQAHPELKSRPNNPHPLFRDFIKAALAQ